MCSLINQMPDMPCAIRQMHKQVHGMSLDMYLYMARPGACVRVYHDGLHLVCDCCIQDASWRLS